MVQAIEEADAAGAPLLILRLDTPGGLVASTRKIIKSILASTATTLCVFLPVIFLGGGGRLVLVQQRLFDPGLGQECLDLFFLALVFLQAAGEALHFGFVLGAQAFVPVLVELAQVTVRATDGVGVVALGEFRVQQVFLEAAARAGNPAFQIDVSSKHGWRLP